MIDIDVLIIENLKKQQRQREIEEEDRRLRLPIPNSEFVPLPREEQREPKRVIEIQL